MLNRRLIESEFSFLGEDIFLNVSSVVMPPIRVQKAYESFMQDYIAKPIEPSVLLSTLARWIHRDGRSPRR